MLGVVETVGIGKVGSLAAQLTGALVHQRYKVGNRAGHGLGQNIGGLVGGDDQQAVEQLLYREYLAGLNAGGAAVIVDTGDSHVGGGDGLGEGQITPVYGLQGQQGRHDLGDAGRIGLFLFIMTIEHTPGGLIHQQGALGIQNGTVQCGCLGH